MGIFKGIGLLAAIAGAGVVLFAQKRSAETGKDIKDIMANLPEEMKAAADEMKGRLQEASGEFKKAAAQREAEIDELIAEEEARLEVATREQAEAGTLV